MRDSVHAAFVKFSAKFEGVCPWMYLDVRNLVTTAIGNLIDPIGECVGIPFLRPDGTHASWMEIEDEWNRVKSRTDLAKLGGFAFRAATTLRLDEDGVASVVEHKMSLIDSSLRKRFPGYETWPADAQLGVLSMAWAMGPGFRFPKFADAAEVNDFATCADECKMNEAGNPGLVGRNRANEILFLNAQRVFDEGLDPSVLLYCSVS